jgi:hypothetical protein
LRDRCANEYRFLTHWRVPGTPEQVNAILSDPCDLPRWWPQVYLSVHEVEPGVYELHTRGRLPYTLRWRFRRVESRAPLGFTIEAWGELTGRGVWTLTPDGDVTDVTYDWRVRADKPWLRWLSFVMKPVFAANHRWAMERGEESLLAELQRKSAG